MVDQTQNPLSKYFRQPQLHLRLPSQGRWWKKDSLNMPVTGELPVYAMTARDELAVKTPDALLNGQATVDVIQSCCPSITNAWDMPSVDMDAILIAMRIATYGNQMEFISVCPHCNTKNEHAADLDVLSSKLTCPDYDTTVKINGLEIFLKPQTFYDFNQASMKTFDEQRLLSVVENESITESEKIIKFNQLFRSILDTTVKQISKNVAAIKLDSGETVDNEEFLLEFFANCDRPVWNAVKNRLMELGDQSELKNLPLTCEQEECGKPYTAPLVFELSSFFG